MWCITVPSTWHTDIYYLCLWFERNWWILGSSLCPHIWSAPSPTRCSLIQSSQPAGECMNGRPLKSTSNRKSVCFHDCWGFILFKSPETFILCSNHCDVITSRHFQCLPPICMCFCDINKYLLVSSDHFVEICFHFNIKGSFFQFQKPH